VCIYRKFSKLLVEGGCWLTGAFVLRASPDEPSGGTTVLDAGYLAVRPTRSWDLPDTAALSVPGGGAHLPCGPAHAQLLVSFHPASGLPRSENNSRLAKDRHQTRRYKSNDFRKVPSSLPEPAAEAQGWENGTLWFFLIFKMSGIWIRFINPKIKTSACASFSL
jgi:hypothetical protein